MPTIRIRRVEGDDLRGQRTRWFSAAMAAVLALTAHAAVPRLETQGTATRLWVHDAPMLILGGELGNSSASSAQYMAPHWAKLRAMHLNTVLAPIYWELIEPTEGKLDFASVDSLIKNARANNLKLVLLWFGAWKNSMSTYVPPWVKRDPTRFPRAQLPNGQGVEILSAFAPATRDADARAFAALMGHLKRVDENQNTVVMVQVENEIGMLPIAREYGSAPDRLFKEPVPEELIRKLAVPADNSEWSVHQLWKEHGAKRSGDWTTLFGEGDAAAEVFTAWHYARYTEAVTAAGKRIYPLPMYVNAALNRIGKAPGEYPSGGPLPHLLDVWKAGAPSLDFLAPDIYFPSFVELATRFRRADNPLFIPEGHNANTPEVPANAFYAFGKLDAIGFGPFSIESIDDAIPSPLSEGYAVLEQLSPAILASVGLNRMSGFKPRVLEDGTVIDLPVTETIGQFRFTVTFVDFQGAPKAEQKTAAHGGIIIQTAPEEYLIAGQGIIVTFKPVGEGPPLAGIDSAWEGAFDSRGTWVPGRLLNGDQTHQGRHVRLAPGKFQIQRVRLYRYR
jgi:beta-galactosidase GanA